MILHQAGRNWGPLSVAGPGDYQARPWGGWKRSFRLIGGDLGEAFIEFNLNIQVNVFYLYENIVKNTYNLT